MMPLLFSVTYKNANKKKGRLPTILFFKILVII